MSLLYDTRYFSRMLRNNEIFRKINRYQDPAERQMTVATFVIIDMENTENVENTSDTSCSRVNDVIIISCNY